MPVLCKQPVLQGEVLQCFHNLLTGVLTVERDSRGKMKVMFFKQRQNYSRNIVPEQLIQWSHPENSV